MSSEDSIVRTRIRQYMATHGHRKVIQKAPERQEEKNVLSKTVVNDGDDAVSKKLVADDDSSNSK